MVSVSRATHNIGITAESLQEDLNRLEIQKQALERELAAVVAHLSSVQRALGALQVLMVDSADSAPSAAEHSAVPATRQPTASSAPRAEDVPAAAGDGAPSDRPAAKRRSAGAAHSPAAVDADAQKSYGKLTEQILEYFSGIGDSDVRARDVAAALGRDTDSGAINAVRSTLDRLVGTSRIRRSGRGLYRRA